MRICGRRTAAAGGFDPEYELLDTGVFDQNRYWIAEVWYAKADPADVLMTVRVNDTGLQHQRHRPCAANGVVPQHMVLGSGGTQAGAGPGGAIRR